MMCKKIYIPLLAIVALLAWAPWLTYKDAQTAIEQQFAHEYRQGDPKFSNDCKLEKLDNFHRVPFAYRADVTYQCGTRNIESGVIHFTFLKTVWGVPLE
jgi:hypothetical protein